MGEKRKWFDQKPMHLPEAILGISEVSVEEALEVLHTLHGIRGPKAAKAAHLISRRASMRPAKRLSVNLKTLLDQLAVGGVNSVIPEGLTHEELQALIVLQTHEIPPNIREAAQGLLNVYERYLLLAAVNRMFRDERSRSWEISFGKLQTDSCGVSETTAVPRYCGGGNRPKELPPGQGRSRSADDSSEE